MATRHIAVRQPREARRAVAEIASLVRYPDLLFMVQLLVTELVGNAARHSGLRRGEHVLLAVDADDETVRVEVADRGRGFDPLARLRLHAAGDAQHHGLTIVDALADRWGFRSAPGDCRVWFEIDLVAGRRPWRGRAAISPGGAATPRAA